MVEDLGISPGSIVAFDPHSEPLALWRRRSRNIMMTHLRSPASHGLHTDFRTIRRFATARGRTDFTLPYHRPSAELFDDHARTVLADTWSRVARRVESVRAVFPVSGGYVLSGESTEATAKRVILAPGQPAPRVPEWAAAGGVSIPHIYDDGFDVSRFLTASSAAIVGGGLGAVTLAVTAAERGCKTTLITRDPRTVHYFDSDPGYIGPRCGPRFAAIRRCRDRRELIRAARRTGSVPPDAEQRLTAAIRAGAVSEVRDEVVDRVNAPGRVELIGRSGRYGPFERVVLATGFADAPPAGALIRQIARATGARLAPDGFPLVDESLQWTMDLYVSGALAELTVGPPARNIIGAHLAARRMFGAYPSSTSSSSCEA